MYGKRRVSISKNGEISICGKYPESNGGSHQRLGYINELSDGSYGVHFCNGKLIATVKTKTDAKIAIFNASMKSDQYFSGCRDQINEKGVLSRKP
jgi:hypothetical protein